MDLPQNIHLIHGPPGCGKTTFVVKEAVEVARLHGPEKVLIASLTKTAAQEVRARKLPIPPRQVGTLHSFAFRALGLQSDDLARIEDCFLARWNLHEEYSRLRAARIPPRSWGWRMMLFGALWRLWKRRRGLFDFEDMIERAIEETTAAPGEPHVIFVDEAQDHSASELRLAFHWARECDKLVLVGDVDQCIFGFRGADPEVLRQVPRRHERTLSRSHRVPRAVHRAAMDWIAQVTSREDVEYTPRHAEGRVRRLDATLLATLHLVEDIQRQVAAGRTVMVLASCGHLLRELLHDLRHRGLAFHHPFQPKQLEWNPLEARDALLAFVMPTHPARGDHRPRPWTWRELWRWFSRVDARQWLQPGARREVEWLARGGAGGQLVAPSAGEAMERVRSFFLPARRETDLRRPATLLELCAEWHRANLALCVKLLEAGTLFDEPRIVAGTIHSVKGGEADVVYVAPDLSPASNREWLRGGTGRDEVLRMFYVAFTRAREELVLLDAIGERAVSWRPLGIDLDPPTGTTTTTPARLPSCVRERGAA
ncbi:MAG: ATP-dependent helicase [Armatimonadetes bacterium]|nr:ATP-dependent helicase [Armatimonadota bacterium]